MEENLIKLSCGECGNDKHIIYAKHKSHSTIQYTDALFISCTNCDTITKLSIPTPKISLNNYSGSGCLANFNE